VARKFFLPKIINPDQWYLRHQRSKLIVCAAPILRQGFDRLNPAAQGAARLGDGTLISTRFRQPFDKLRIKLNPAAQSKGRSGGLRRALPRKPAQRGRQAEGLWWEYITTVDHPFG